MTEGKTDTALVFNLADEKERALAKDAEERSAIMAAKMAPEGGLQLPELLDKRRLEHGITDAHFAAMATFDAVYVKQIRAAERTEGGLVKAESQVMRETQNTFRGILVDAGLKALDELKSHGISLGQIVYFIKHVSSRIHVDTNLGKDEYLLVMRSGDIVGSEDLAHAKRAGLVRVVSEIETEGPNKGAPAHRMQYKDPQTGEWSESVAVLNPWISEDL